MPNLKMIDLFAGVGGFHYGFQDYAECVFVSEKDANAAKVYSLNHNIERIDGDITNFPVDEIPAHDLLCAGFPCQPFSVAGLRNGFNDTRGTLFWNIADILDQKRPRIFVLENVKNLVSHDKGNTFKIILDVLTNQLGYHVKHKILNTTTHGNIPHNRERIYIVGFANLEDYRGFEFPEEIPRNQEIGDLLDFHKRQPAKYYQTNLNSPSVVKMHQWITERYQIYQYRRYYLRANKKNVCPTLTANMGTGGHNVPLVMDDYGIRKLTPRECFTLQGYSEDFLFPEKMTDSNLYKQAGNTVSVTVVKRIADNIMKAITHA